jgi:hypothetical protein
MRNQRFFWINVIEKACSTNGTRELLIAIVVAEKTQDRRDGVAKLKSQTRQL